MNTLDKLNPVIKDGKVAVLVSPEYGAGWSSWNGHDNPKVKQFMVMDATLVNMARKKCSTEEVEQYLIRELGDEDHICCVLGWSDIKVFWIPLGERFRIEEYDGSERLYLLNEDTSIMVAGEFKEDK